MPESRHAGGLDDAGRIGTIFGQEKIITTYNLLVPWPEDCGFGPNSADFPWWACRPRSRRIVMEKYCVRL